MKTCSKCGQPKMRTEAGYGGLWNMASEMIPGDCRKVLEEMETMQ